MPIATLDLEAIGERLAQARRAGLIAADVDLAGLTAIVEAEDLRDVTLRHLG